jgi:hypothetical protein
MGVLGQVGFHKKVFVLPPKIQILLLQLFLFFLARGLDLKT